MTMVSAYPCDDCESSRMVYDVPPYGICLESPTHDYECPKMAEIARVDGRACQVAELIASEPDRRLRAVEAQNAADSYANTLYELGAEIDDTAFLSACGVPAGCVQCKTRTVADGWGRLCPECTEAVAA